MKIEKVVIHGFGTFNKGIDVDFGEDRLSVVMGRNEAGKSTLMSAVFGILFGFKDAAVRKKFEPWEEHTFYGGEVQVCTDAGRRVRFKRDFTDNTTEVDEFTDGAWETVFLGIANPRGHSSEDVEYYRLLESVVGFQDESIFRGTVFVGQNALQTSITDQTRKLVSGSTSTDFKGVLHDLHYRFSEITMENPWRKRTKAKPRQLEIMKTSLDEDVKNLETARETFMRTVGLEQEVKNLERSLTEKKSAIEDNRTTLSYFERFCKLVRDRDAARVRFLDSNKRRETYMELRDKVEGIERTLATELKRFEVADDQFPELVVRLKSETRELEQEEGLLTREQATLHALRPVPNDKLGAVLGVLGAAIGVVIHLMGATAIGVLVGVLAGLGLFFLGRTLATGYKERKAELETSVKAKEAAIRSRNDSMRAIIEQSRGLLGEVKTEEVLADYRRYKSLHDEADRLRSSMSVLGEWDEIDSTYQKTAEENLRCNGLMEIILRDAPYLTEISEDHVAVANSMEELKRRIGELTVEVEATSDVLTEAKVELARVSSDADHDLPALESEIAGKQRRVENLELERDSLKVVIDTLEECVDEFQEGDLTTLSEEVSELFRKITGNRYTRVTLSANMEPMVTKYDNTHIAPSDLSQGTQDQLYFAMRVAIARHLSQNESLPFFLDDPFVNFDQERLDVTREMLEHIDDHQVIMVTCDRNYESWSRNLLDLDRARADALAADSEQLVLAPEQRLY